MNMLLLLLAISSINSKRLLASSNDLISTSFEDSNISSFLARGGVTLTVKTDGGKTGNNYLLVSGRTSTWHGVQVALDNICTPKQQYSLSVQIKTPTAGQVSLSMQYTDSAGKEHYSNLRSVSCSGDWVAIEGFKFIMPSDVSKVYLYFESSTATLDIMLDDFVLAKVQHDDEDTLIETSFEDGDYSFFLPRGSVSLTVGTNGGSTGSKYLKVSGRTSSWNGVQISLSDLCEAGEQYLLSAKIKTPSSGQVSLSMQYTDSSGTDHYSNLKSVTSSGNWAAIEDYKFNMPSGVTGVYIYFECSTATLDIYLDDVVLRKAPSTDIETKIPSLKDVFAEKFRLGTAVTVAELSPKTTQKLILKHFNSITLGNELKPDALLDQQATKQLYEETGDNTTPVISLGSSTIILDFCEKNGIPVRGHTLVWHSQTPTWFFKDNWDINGSWVDKSTMLKRMENYIKLVFETVSKAYPNIDFYAWDVVNEAWTDNGTPRTAGTLEENPNYSPWVKVFGDNSFIKYAFQYAKKYVMSGCKLFYNDFNEYVPAKTKAIVSMVTELNSSEKLIDGIGLQSHLDISYPSASVYETAVKAFVETGLDVQVTELDATVSGNSESLFKSQANYYKSIMSVLLKYSDKISAVVFWGTLDSTSWRASKYPLLFNGDYTSKEAFKAIVGLLDTGELINTSFEDNNLGNFSPRGSVTLTVETNGGKTGNNYLKVSGRTSSWNGVQLALDDYCEAGVQYSLSVQIKTPSSGQVTMSMQYTDSSGKDHYNNLRSVDTSSSSWVGIEEFKFIMPKDVSNVLLYFESSTATLDIYLDDFVLKKVENENKNSLIDTSFEDGDYSFFLPRGSVTLTVKTDGGKTGNNYLLVSGRTNNWNGVQVSLDDLCEVGEQYTLSAQIKTPTSGQVTLSMQYTDSSGKEHYSNLRSVTSSGDWVGIEGFKFIMPKDVTGVYLYFECSSSTLDIMVDDFSLKKVENENKNSLIDTSFEDGDYSFFLPRGSVTLTVKTDGGKTGNNYLLVSGRTNNWNGVQVSLDDLCEVGEQYTLSAQIKTPTSGQVTLSMQYTDSSGKEHYSNLRSVTSSGDWVGIEGFKFIMPKDVTGVYLYFECSSSTLDIMVDDFSLKKVQNENENSLIETSFEDGDYSFFQPRGSVSLTVPTDGGHTGSRYLKVSGRTSTWNGVQIPLSDLCEVGEQYVISTQIKTPYYGQVTLSMQYTDSSGTDHYNNLKTVISQGSWVAIEDYKFTMPKDVTGVLLYFESSTATLDICLDDFTLKKAASSGIETDIPSLKDVFANKFKLGTAVGVFDLSSKNTEQLILKHFNSITLGNELKPDALLDQQATLTLAQQTGDYTTPVINLGQAKTILDFCQLHDIPVRGHTLVWHSQTPTWFFKEKWDANGNWVDSDTMLKRMENYIKTVFETVENAYPKVNFYAWDVVNEAWLDNGQPRNAGSQEENSNNSPWVKIFGDNSFIKYAFQYAKKYAMSGCKLYYNDFNEYMPDKTKAIVAMVEELNSSEQLIDGIGLQSHLDVSFPSASAYETAVKAFVATGLDLQVTELDATVSGNTEALFKTQAEYYKSIFSVLLKYSDNISAVVIWGTLDSTSWRASKYPLLFNEDYTSKEAFKAIVELV